MLDETAAVPVTYPKAYSPTLDTVCDSAEGSTHGTIHVVLPIPGGKAAVQAVAIESPPPPEPVQPLVMITNRGEIARRVIRTCTRLGLRTLAVFTTPDALAPHVR